MLPADPEGLIGWIQSYLSDFRAEGGSVSSAISMVVYLSLSVDRGQKSEN